MLSEVVDQIIERGKEEGKEEGKKQGKEEGLEQGLRQKARETARRMLVEGISVEVISRVTGLPVAEIRELSQDSDNGRE